MTRVNILQYLGERGGVSYCAVAGDKRSVGDSAGQALDKLTEQLAEDDVNTLVIVQHLGPDQFFTSQQQARLAELMDRWRTSRDAGGTLAPDDQAELDTLVEAELRASAARATVIVDELAR
jgi:hypothetical protein